MLRRLAFWALLPLSAVQGLWLRRVATRLPGTPGRRQGRSGEGDELRLLAIGDSIIDGVGIARVEDALPVQFAQALAERLGRQVRWRIEGQSGLDIEDVIERFESLDPDWAPDIILVSVGVNDVTGLSSSKRWRQSLQHFLDSVSSRWPGARMVFAGLPPMARFPLPPQPLRFSLGLRAGRFDDIARELIGDYPRVVHVPTDIDPQHHPFCSDGFHPAAESCNLWARELADIEARSGNHESSRSHRASQTEA